MATLKDKLTARNGQQIDTAFARIFDRETLTVAQERDRAVELIHQARAAQSEMIGRGIAYIFRPLGALVRRLAEAHRARSAMRVLHGMDDRMLADIGVFRGDIDAAAHRLAANGNARTRRAA